MHHSLLSLFAALITLLALPSCNFDEEKEHHLLHLRYLNADALHLYADQTTNTLTLTATDSWHLDLQYLHADDANHLQLSPTARQLPAGNKAEISTKLICNLTPNTGDSVRQVKVRVTPATDRIEPLNFYVIQHPHLHIQYPEAQYDPKTKKVVFIGSPFRNNPTTSLAFILYDKDSTTHSLTSDADWLTVPARFARPTAGAHSVDLEVSPNPTASERTAHVTLTSNGVSTVITYVQAAAGGGEIKSANRSGRADDAEKVNEHTK